MNLVALFRTANKEFSSIIYLDDVYDVVNASQNSYALRVPLVSDEKSA